MEESVKPKVLIVEDNDILNDLIAEKLSGAGYRFISAKSSDSTVDFIRQVQPAVILIDVVFPKELGFRLIEGLRADSGLAGIPVIAIVKAEDSVVAEHAQALDVKYVVDKVIFRADDLLVKISSCLSSTDLPKGQTEVEVKEENAMTAKEEAEAAVQSVGGLLLVEDDAFMRELFSESLRKARFVVEAAEDAETGLAILDKGFLPDIILLDLLLPGKSGFDFLTEVKQKDALLNIPVVVVSNLGSRGDIDRAMNLGAADFLIKANATIDEIIVKAKDCMEKSKKVPHLPKSVISVG